MFLFTGLAHFTKMKHELARMVPDVFPRPLLVIYATGVLEFLGAAGLLLPRFRASGLILPDFAPDRHVSSERESGAGTPYAAWETRHCALAARAHAAAIHRPSLVVNGEVSVTSLDPSSEGSDDCDRLSRKGERKDAGI
jgi:hypothetical protein